ncbi:MAG: hypothetical protein K9H26_06690 [Prolixibacteraceae bacterium]|nr:hypothetical protein [Prolixibacteraceae bacterium]
MIEARDLFPSKIILLFILCVFLGFSCVDKKIEAVKIVYLPEGLNVITAIDSCDKIYDHSTLLRDTIIEDEIFIRHLYKTINSLNRLDTSCSNYDFRIRCILKMEDGTKKVLCIGEYFGTVYDGKLYEDSPELFKLIKETIYRKIDN